MLTKNEATRVADDMAGLLRQAGATPDKAIKVQASILAAWERQVRAIGRRDEVAALPPGSRLACLLPPLALVQGGRA